MKIEKIDSLSMSFVITLETVTKVKSLLKDLVNREKDVEKRAKNLMFKKMSLYLMESETEYSSIKFIRLQEQLNSLKNEFADRCIKEYTEDEKEVITEKIKALEGQEKEIREGLEYIKRELNNVNKSDLKEGEK